MAIRKPETEKIRFFFGHKVPSCCGKLRRLKFLNFFFPEALRKVENGPRKSDRFRGGLRNLENNEKLCHFVNKLNFFLGVQNPDSGMATAAMLAGNRRSDEKSDMWPPYSGSSVRKVQPEKWPFPVSGWPQGPVLRGDDRVRQTPKTPSL